MFFSKKNIVKKQFSSEFTVYEYCINQKDFPIDGAVIELNEVFGPKLNKGFYELFFVLSGKMQIEINDKVYIIEKEEMFIVPSNTKHKITGINLRAFVVCNPPFDPKNMTFFEK